MKTRTLGSSTSFAKAILLIIVPLLSAIGASQRNTAVLMVVIGLIVTLVVLTVFSERLIPLGLHPLVIYVIALALLFQSDLISKYLVGYDVFIEYYVFNQVSASSFWTPALSSLSVDVLNYNAMTSVTILPAAYSTLLNIPGEWVFDILYNLLYSLVPLILYAAFSQRFSKPVSFLAVILFTTFPRFYTEERRVMVAEIFLALLVFLILNRSIKPWKRQLLILVFGGSMALSHYSTTYLFLACSAFAVFTIGLTDRLRGRSALEKRLALSASSIVFLFVVTFSWYTMVSTSPSATLLQVIIRVYTSFYGDFFNVGSRGEMISSFAGQDFSQLPITAQVDFFVSKIPYILIVLGILSLFWKRKTSTWLDYDLIALANTLILFMVLLIPYFGPALLPNRFYHLSLFFLAPVSIIGGLECLKWISKRTSDLIRWAKWKELLLTLSHHDRWKLRLLGIVLIAIFLFKVGAIYEFTGEAAYGSQSLSFDRMKSSTDPNILNRLYEKFSPDEDVFGAKWMSSDVSRKCDLFGDLTATKRVLMGYGGRLPDNLPIFLTNGTDTATGGYVYLRLVNMNGGVWVTTVDATRFASTIDVLNSQGVGNANLIYSNGGSQVFNFLNGPEGCS